MGGPGLPHHSRNARGFISEVLPPKYIMKDNRKIIGLAGWLGVGLIFVGLTFLISYGSSFFFQRSVLLEAAAVDVAPPPPAPNTHPRPQLRVIIASRYSPSAGAVYYNDLLKYL